MALFTFLKSVTPKYIDWEVTCLFYASLHRVQEHIEIRGDAGEVYDHVTRLDYVRVHFPSIYPDYRALYSQSLKSRYNAELMPSARDRDAAEARCRRILAALP